MKTSNVDDVIVKTSSSPLLLSSSPPPPWCPSHLDALHCLVDGLQQGSVLRVLVAVFVGEHAGESVYVAVEVLLRQRLLLHTQVHTILDVLLNLNYSSFAIIH